MDAFSLGGRGCITRLDSLTMKEAFVSQGEGACTAQVSDVDGLHYTPLSSTVEAMRCAQPSGVHH